MFFIIILLEFITYVFTLLEPHNNLRDSRAGIYFCFDLRDEEENRVLSGLSVQVHKTN